MPASKNYKATAWGNTSEELTCPSGQVCLARRPDIKKMVGNGTLNNLDTFTSLVDQKHVSRKSAGGKNSAKSQQMQNDMTLQKILKDPEKFADMMEMVDKVVIATVVAPELHPYPENEDDRIEGVVYVDTVQLEDKMYLLNFAFGGTRDIARFRGELQQSVDSLADVAGVEDSP